MDLGAQYLTQRHTWSEPYFENLKNNGLIKTLDTTNIPGFKEEKVKKEDYVCCKGTGSIVKKLFEQADIIENIKCNIRVSSVVKGHGRMQFDVTAETEKNIAATESFDIIISTIPIPQVLQLQKIDMLIPDSDMKTKLQNVKYTTRYALGLFYDENVVLDESDHIINFVQDDVIRYWSLENMKRAYPAKTSDEPAAVTVHTSVDFGAQHIDDDKDSQKQYLLEKAKEKIKSIREISPSYVQCHKWKYSQVLEPFAGGAGVVEISTNPLFLLSGDGMSFSGFEGCIFSAEQTINYLQKSIKQ